MKRKQILILLMGAMMALSACQATPEEDVIVQKAEQQEKLTQAADVAPELVGKSLRDSGDDQFSGDVFQRKACLYG